MSKLKTKRKEYLYEMYNATSTDDGKGGLETYENWLERQLLSRIDKVKALENWKESKIALAAPLMDFGQKSDLFPLGHCIYQKAVEYLKKYEELQQQNQELMGALEDWNYQFANNLDVIKAKEGKEKEVATSIRKWTHAIQNNKALTKEK